MDRCSMLIEMCGRWATQLSSNRYRRIRLWRKARNVNKVRKKQTQTHDTITSPLSFPPDGLLASLGWVDGAMKTSSNNAASPLPTAPKNHEQP